MRTSRSNKPRVAITMGDPAGVGPEVVLAAMAPASLPDRQAGVRRGATIILVGDAAWWRRVARRRRLSWPPACEMWDAGQVPASVVMGRVQAAAGRAALQALDGAIALALRGQVEAVVTAPISKEAISCGGRRWTGHTEHLARACGVSDPVMMFVAGPLTVSLVTTHQSLAQAIRAVTPARVTRVITRTAHALTQEFGVQRPRVAVAALNPHAGEGGVLGREESRWLAPLIRRLQRTVLPAQLSGPWPADTLFAQAARGQYDAVVAMYHDQALIPVKLLAWERAVNVTLGLPFVRTSPSHGTAFDLAGTGRADPTSMRHAIQLAITLARRRIATGPGAPLLGVGSSGTLAGPGAAGFAP